MSGVWVNNFTNHLFYIANEICRNQDISFEILKPLIKETFEKINDDITPYDAQTGPAKRNDNIVIQKHLSILESDSNLYQLYSLLTNSILKTYHDKL